MAKAEMQQLTPAVAFELREAMALLRQGSLAAARARAETALDQFPGHGAIHAFLGALCCRTGDTAAGIPHLRAALEANTDDVTIAANLTAALIDTEAFDDAALVCSEVRADRDPSHRLWRLRGYIGQQRGDHENAVRAYERVVAHAPDDSESWNNLGNARAAIGRQADAILALEQAARLRPDSAPIRLNLAATLSQAGRLEDAVAILEHFTRAHPDDPKPLIDLAALLRHLCRDAEALDVLERAVAASPGDAGIRVQLGEEWGAAFDFAKAEMAFRDALAIEPGHSGAYVQLALLLEHTNREADLPALRRAAETAGASIAAILFIEVLICRREREFARGLATLRDIPADIEPIRRAQFEGQFRDRLGDTDDAFAAFGEMNRLFKLDPSDPLRRGEATRAKLLEESALVTPEWYRGWQAASPAPARPAPVFLVGFPRSGTTLLDTMLMGHPDVQVLEERPPLRQVEDRLGGMDLLPRLDEDAIAALRDHYFAQAGRCVDLRSDALLIDKSPLHMNKVPLIHRLFPEARFILALRHPCDVVLSCFMTSFRLNDAMASFLDLETTAEFYDLSFAHWTNCTSIMPVTVHPLRYEEMVENPEVALRALLKSLDLAWHPSVMDHRNTARERGTISSASYAQVTENIYRRAFGRWQRYRSHLEPVLPVLAPWVERFGY